MMFGQKLDLPLSTLRGKLKAPLKPICIVRSLGLPRPSSATSSTSSSSHYTPIYLLMASTHSPKSTSISTTYIQGAADDAESWSYGLTAPVFWEYKDLLLSTAEDELEGVIGKCVREWEERRMSGVGDDDDNDHDADDDDGVGDGDGGVESGMKTGGVGIGDLGKDAFEGRRVEKAPWLGVGMLPSANALQSVPHDRLQAGLKKGKKLVVVCAPLDYPLSISTTGNRSLSAESISEDGTETQLVAEDLERSRAGDRLLGSILHLPLPTNPKLAARELRSQFIRLEAFVSVHQQLLDENGEGRLKQITVCCATGKDISIGVALALLCLYGDETGLSSSSFFISIFISIQTTSSALEIP